MSAAVALARWLAETPLRGREVRELAIPNSSELAYAVDAAPDELRSAWQTARPSAETFQRWPVFVTDYGGAVSESTFRASNIFGEPMRPDETLAAAASVTLEQALAYPWVAESDYYEREWHNVVKHDLDEVRRRVGTAPTPEEIHALELKPDHVALERWLLDWEEARRPTHASEGGGHLEWHEPTWAECAVVWLPIAEPFEVPAYLPFFGDEGRGGAEAMIAVLRSWHDRFSAEVVASLGTVMFFNVPRPPTALAEAFALAHEQKTIADSTAVGMSIREHARALLGREEWMIHRHP